MYRDDEDELERPLSDTRNLIRSPDHQEQERRKQALQLRKLKAQTDRKKLQDDMNRDPSAKPQEEGTKTPTRREEEARDIESANEKAIADQMIKDTKRGEAAKDAASYEQQKDAG